MPVPTATLPDGELPVVGKGTYRLDGDTARTAVSTALETGYTHLDTAEGYHNESEIGDVLAENDRESVFLTSKVLPKNLDYESVIDACESSLERLGTDYLDLYLIHWPNPAISVRETMGAMATLHDRGLVRNVGVSNFSRYQLSAALHVSDVPIAVNQIEFNPWYARQELVDYCQKHDIVVQAAAPLGRAAVLEDPVVQDLAEKHDVMPAQVCLRWELQKDIVVLPQSTNADHIRANLNLFGWELEDEDMRRMDELHRGQNAYQLNLDDPIYGITP